MNAPALIAVAWCAFQPRTEALAAVLGGRAAFIHASRWRRAPRALLPLRYLVHAATTWRLLSRLRPRTVLAITPPVFAPLVAWAWCKVHGARLVVDCHTDAFHSRKWGWARPLHRWLLRRAQAVTLHTQQHTILVSSWGAAALLLPDDVPDGTQASPQPAAERPRVLVAGSLDPQEPIGAVLAAAALIPDVEFRITGDPARIPVATRAQAPVSAVFTGYVPYPRFLGELQAAHVVAAFSTDPNIMNRAAYEAVGLGCPLVLSDLPGLRARFGSAALFCANEPAAMAGTLRRALGERATLAHRSMALAATLRSEREAALTQLRARLASAPATRVAPARVLMVSQHPYPTNYVLRRNVAHLLGQGLEVDLICTRAGRSGPDTPPGLRVHSLPVPHRRSALWYAVEYFAFFALALPLVCGLALRRRYRVVQVDTVPDFLVFVALLPRWRGARVVLYMYELMPEMTAARLKLSPAHLLVRWIRRIEGAAARWADQVVTVSDHCRRILEARGVPAAKIAVVPNSPLEPNGLPAATARGTPAPPVLMTHSTLVERYGVQLALEALAHLQPNWPGLRLEVLGEGEYAPHLRQLAEQLQVAHQVAFRGFLPWPQAMEAVRRATLGIVPIIADGYGQLLLPGKLFDYVSLQVPVVCARLTTIEEYFPPDTLAYFPPGDAAALAAQVDRLLRNPAEARDQAMRAARAMRRLAWEQVAPQYLAALRPAP
jgi:glycosyltransferase involved in cell wall biosynthesis